MSGRELSQAGSEVASRVGGRASMIRCLHLVSPSSMQRLHSRDETSWFIVDSCMIISTIFDIFFRWQFKYALEESSVYF